MKIRVIGGGWYGCHIALALLHDGHQVTLFERGYKLFFGASGANQSRLHAGHHYPRDAQTRAESLRSFSRFMASPYADLTLPVRTNIYCIAKDVSLIDWTTYRDIMAAAGNEFLTVDPKDYGLVGIEGAMLTGERLIMNEWARVRFTNALDWNFEVNKEITSLESSEWDATIDCTFNAFGTFEIEEVQPCIMLLYDGPTDVAVTVMDGPEGTSVYPYDEQRVSLTSVSETPLARVKTIAEGQQVIASLTPDDISAIRHKMETRIRHYFPAFSPHVYSFSGLATSCRVKPKSMTDRRTCVVHRDANVITVFPGKISGVFDAEEMVRRQLKRVGAR
jgi:hypothetical protein